MYKPSNSNPTVDGLVPVYMSFAARSARHVFPTPLSPITISLNVYDGWVLES